MPWCTLQEIPKVSGSNGFCFPMRLSFAWQWPFHAFQCTVAVRESSISVLLHSLLKSETLDLESHRRNAQMASHNSQVWGNAVHESSPLMGFFRLPRMSGNSMCHRVRECVWNAEIRKRFNSRAEYVLESHRRRRRRRKLANRFCCRKVSTRPTVKFRGFCKISFFFWRN